MPNVRMPNGDVVRFPDDMPREQIKGLIASKFPEVANTNQPQETSFLQDMGENFKHGIQSGKDLLTGNFQAVGQYKPTPKTEALADKIFAGIDDPSLSSIASSISRNIGNTSASDYSGALLEKFGETPAGKAVSFIAGVNPFYNAAGTALTRYVNPAIEDATGIHPDNLALLELGAAPLGLKNARNVRDPNLTLLEYAKNKSAPLLSDETGKGIRLGRKPVEVATEPSKAMGKVEKRIRADYPDEASYQRALNSYASKQGQSLVEAGGERTANLAEGSAMYPSGGAKAGEFFNEKTGAAPEKLKTTLSKTISEKVNYYDTLDNIVSEGRKEAAPIYSQAFKANQSVKSQVIDRILETPEGQSALKEAAKNMQNEMSLVAKPDHELTALANEAGMRATGHGVGSGLKLRTLDYIKKSMDDSINKAYRAGDEAEARRIVNLKKALVSEMDAADKTGLYSKARSVSGDYLSNKQAMETGLKFLTEDAEVVARSFKEMGKAEKNAYRVGVMKAVRNNIDSKLDGQNVARIFQKPANRQKLQSILSPKDYQKLMADAKATDEIFKLRNQITGNSRTAMRQIARDEFETLGTDITADLVMGTGGALTAGKSAVRAFVRKRFDGLNDKLAGEVADILYETDPKKKYQIVRQLSQQAKGNNEVAIRAQNKLAAFYSMSDAIAKERSALLPGVVNAAEGENPQRLQIEIRPRGNNAPATPDNATPPPATQAQDVGPQSMLFNRVLQQESNGQHFNKDGTVKLGKPTKYGRAVGIAQVLPSTGKDAAKLAGLPWSPERLYKDPAYNAALGEAYLNHQMKRYNGNTVLALMAYNWGQGNVDNWLKNGAKESKIPAETINYVKKILKEG